MSDLYFKATDGMNSTHGGDYRYPGLGRWTRHLDPDRIDPCSYGYHLARNEQILGWLAPTLWLAEPCPDHPVVESGGKVVTCRVRLVERLDGWDERTARLFAADCAEDVVDLTGPDDRCVEAIAVARRFANGDATRAELGAAWHAAWAAAWAAAGDATGDAALDAAWHAAGTAAGAAWAAAGDATGDAALDAAWHAAWHAAWAAAGDAALDATWHAAWQIQYVRLLDYCNLVEVGEGTE